MEPFLGTWTATLAPPQPPASHQVPSATLRVDRSGDAVRLTQSGINGTGEGEAGTTTLHPDGNEDPVDQAPGVLAVSR